MTSWQGTPGSQLCLQAPSASSRPEPADRAAKCFRKLILQRPKDAPRGEALSFTKKDSERLLQLLTEAPEGTLELDHIASCDVERAAEKHPAAIEVLLGLSVPLGHLKPGIKHLVDKGFTTEAGLRLVLVEVANTRDDRPRICRLLTRAPNDEVRAAFVERGVPPDSIVRVAAETVAATGVHTRIRIVHLDPGFPLVQIPWKVALQDPGAAMGPVKVVIEGPHCSACRQQGHKLKQCPSYQERLCGRCGYPMDAITDANGKTYNHDCEGGPAGYGEAHVDLDGVQWHRVYTQHRESQPAPAEVEDPLADVRAASLSKAQAAAQAVRAKRHKKASKVVRGSSGDTPPPKRQHLEQPPPRMEL